MVKGGTRSESRPKKTGAMLRMVKGGTRSESRPKKTGALHPSERSEAEPPKNRVLCTQKKRIRLGSAFAVFKRLTA